MRRTTRDITVTIQWNKELDTGVRSIDLQHRELFTLINELAVLHSAGYDTEALYEVLPQLHTFIQFHFSEEETLMHMLVAEDDFEQQHLAQHREFTAHIDMLQKNQTRQNDAGVVKALVHYLQNWLPEHIASADRELGQRLLMQHCAFAVH